MKKNLFRTFAALALSLPVVASAADLTISGAGASFPAPVYRVWTYDYGQSTGNKVEIAYQSIGSGAGINQIKDKTVDFAGSDAALTKAELDKFGLFQFPMLTGGVVIVVNLRGVPANTLKLDQAAVSGIFLGDIMAWDDPAIQKLNPGVKLPHVRITVVHRSDSSGTSFIFTNYMAKISKKWADTVGCGKAVKWPVGIGGQKNPGVCNNVARVNGSIGYTEYTYAIESNLSMVALKNRDGKFVVPNPKTFSAAGANADWKNAPGFYMVLTDQPGAESWPITGVTYILVYRDQKDAKKAEGMLKYFNWCFTTGANAALKLHYVPLAPSVVEMVRNAWKADLSCGGAPINY